MSKTDKLKARLCSQPKDFTYDELQTLLKGLGYEEKTGGKTGGSRRKFVHSVNQKVILLHKPHPGNILKGYAIRQIIEALNIC